MRTPRKGNLITLTQIRAQLAKAARADACWPLTTGIFARLAAQAAEEDAALGKKRITPWWRTIRDTGQLIDKFPGNGKLQAQRLRREGHTIQKSPRGNALKVAPPQPRPTTRRQTPTATIPA
jgi:hypothetical protein